MNKKNKVLITSIALALVSGLAATSSTFAWFTTTRTASISYSSATIQSNQSNLSIAYVSSLNSSMNNALTNNNLALTGINAITDISGDGVNFFKPTWSATANTATSINAVPTADGYYIDFTVKLTATGNTTMNVYLGTGTEIASANNESKLASRMAVIVDDAVKFIYAPDADYTDATGAVKAGHQYLDEESDSATIVSGTSQNASKTVYTGTLFDSFTTFNSNDAAPAGSLVASLAAVAGTPASKNVTFRIWLEGEDVEADNDANNGVLTASINFFALDA